MITREAFPSIIHEHLPQEEITNALEGVGDYIILEASSYGWVSISTTEYDPEDEKSIIDAGDIYVDKDQFCVLLEEINYKFI